MRQTVNTALSSGSGPDIIFYDAGPGYAGVLASAGLLLPLDDMAAQYGWKDKIIPTAVQGATIDGKFYGMPLQIDLIGSYYNKTIFAKEGFIPPTTVDELLTFCKQASDKGYIPLAFGNNPGWQGFHQFSMLANDMLGPEALGQLLMNNQGTWNSPQITTAIKTFFVDMQNAGCFNPDPNALTYDDANALFYNGDALMTPTGSWLVGDIAENMPDDEVGMIPFPTPTGAQGQYWPSGIGSAFFVSAASKHQTEAGQFIDYLFSPAVAQRWVGEANFFLPMDVDTSSLQLTPLFQSILDVLSSASAGQTTLGYNVDVLAPAAFNDTLQNGLQAVLLGDLKPEELAANLQTTWEQSRT
jgi:raffinose/stachyose/melibiose transport system substrate-binding protein